ncbi:hypothetical protein C5167_037831 [Papaver somniferum]|uniref:Uncharacterized protein n=1 Tax=Papaver somniferum TaxID=3469 RepID=A0A4Y7I7H9_PAPSO|nr:hypothetical protein C5167_037831 [Papaver somniferum]
MERRNIHNEVSSNKELEERITLSRFYEVQELSSTVEDRSSRFHHQELKTEDVSTDVVRVVLTARRTDNEARFHKKEIRNELETTRRTTLGTELSHLHLGDPYPNEWVSKIRFPYNLETRSSWSLHDQFFSQPNLVAALSSLPRMVHAGKLRSGLVEYVVEPESCKRDMDEYAELVQCSGVKLVDNFEKQVKA